MRPIDLAVFSALKDRELKDEGLVIAEGRLLVRRLLDAARRGQGEARGRGGLFPPRFDALGVLCLPSLADEIGVAAAGLCPVAVMSEPELARLAGFPFHRGALAAARRHELSPLSGALPQEGLSKASRLVVLPATIDPENMGSILRSAAALGWDGLLLGPGSCDHLSRRALRVSMGAAFTLPTLSIAGPGELRDLGAAGWQVAAAVLDKDATSLGAWAPPDRLALLFGNEYEGLGPEWCGETVERLTLPMAPGSDSLNAAAAAAIFLHAAAKRG